MGSKRSKEDSVVKAMGYAAICSVITGRAGVDRTRAEAIANSVVQAVAEQVDAQTREALRPHLPTELGQVLSAAEPRGPNRSAQEFVSRVAELDGVTVTQARHPVLATVAALQQALGDELLAEALGGPRGPLVTELVPPPAALHDERTFLETVRDRAGLETTAQAAAAAGDTLAALAERITARQASDLAAYLPQPLRPHLRPAGEEARPSDYAQFLSRIAGQRQPAETRAAAVLATLREAAPEAEIQHALAQLPPELADMFT